MTRRKPPTAGVPDRATATPIRAKRTRGKFYDPTKLTKEGIRSVGGGDSGMFETAGTNRDVWRVDHRVSTLNYTSQIRHSALSGTTGFLALFPGSNGREAGFAFSSSGEVQADLGCSGNAGFRFTAAGANDWYGVAVQFSNGTFITPTPASVSLFTIQMYNLKNVTVDIIYFRGFFLQAQSVAAGDAKLNVEYTTHF